MLPLRHAVATGSGQLRAGLATCQLHRIDRTGNVAPRPGCHAGEFRTNKDDSLYASTPPLESMRVVMSWASTAEVENGVHEHELMINDVRRAYFNARATRHSFIELPDEDPRKSPELVGRLNVCLYGTRGAAKSWHRP